MSSLANYLIRKKLTKYAAKNQISCINYNFMQINREIYANFHYKYKVVYDFPLTGMHAVRHLSNTCRHSLGAVSICMILFVQSWLIEHFRMPSLRFLELVTSVTFADLRLPA